MARIVVFDTHPIQYRSPVFRALFREQPALKVYFFNSTFEGDKWWFSERATGSDPHPGADRLQGFPSRTLHLSGRSLLTKWRTLTAVLADEKPGAVVVFGYYLPEHWMLRLATARLGIPLVFVGENFGASGSFWRRALRAALLPYFFRGVSRFVAIGEKSAALYRELGVAEEKIVLGKYCVDVSFFARSEAESIRLRGDLRRRMGIEETAFVLLFVGRLFYRKRPFDALSLHERIGNPSLCTVIAGAGPLETSLRRNAPSGVHVLGFVEQRDLVEVYHGADALFVPSEHETWGLVVNEAASAAKPALVTDKCGSAGDLVLPETTGLVFPVGDLGRAAREIERWIRDRALAAEMGRLAHQRVAGLYGVERFARALAEASEQREAFGAGTRRGKGPDSGPKPQPAFEY